MKPRLLIIRNWAMARPTVPHQATFLHTDQLEQDVQGIHRKFYSFQSMFRRLPTPLNTSAIASWVLNLSQRRMSAHANEGHNFTSY